MAIVDGPRGTPADMAATVWDLAEAFAVLAAVTDATGKDAQRLHNIAYRLQKRADAIGKSALSAHLDPAIRHLALRAGL